MPTDPHGQAHTGTYGLFDDPDEFAQTTAREEAHEIHRLEGQIRRQERRDRRLDQKEEKAAKRTAAGKAAKSKSQSKIVGLFGKFFGGNKTPSTVGGPAVSVRIGGDGDGSDEEGVKEFERVKRPGYKIVRRPATPDQVYHAKDMEAVDSPWLRECGMVKVKSEGAGGCHIVSKTDIEKSE
ncbi:hypothetical protein BKA58DRAFT_387523 [Alternaria rosae]|uniref:uncharacterized protein n=1 Tax=Alternaria rosae TaxID=1187941 RepID=UPI001E8E2F94|nr:uncharacterized protein BKA58DRAFT_387523 [Alternaria rosae]KAH6868745.1 hypothetical protein BKA58DRAFT_387523 [Alternaria rosae]